MSAFIPNAPAVPAVEFEDDAGTGADAGDTMATATRILPEQVYRATMATPLDTVDYYVSSAPAGAPTELRYAPGIACIEIQRPNGQRIPTDCVLDANGVSMRFAAPGGDYYARFVLTTPAAYVFSAAIDGDAPALVPQAEDDAGSGTDAGDSIRGATPIDRDRVYHATLLAVADPADVYVGSAPAGSPVEFRYAPGAICPDLVDETTAEIAAVCQFDGASILLKFNSPGQDFYVRFRVDAGAGAPAYWLGFGVDGPAPRMP